MTELEAANAALRDAVETRLAGRSAMAAGLAGCQPALEAATAALTSASHFSATSEESSEFYSEWTPPEYARPTTVARATLLQALDAVDDRHTKYGPPAEHFQRTADLVNAAFGTTFSAADWALVMVLDKVARQRGPGATDDAAIDIAGYAACHQECRHGG